MTNTPPPISPTPRKISPLAWILVGLAGLFVCIGLVVVAGGYFVLHKVKQAGLDPELMERNPALAVTKFLTTMNPDIDVLNVDERKGVITVREKDTGKTFTMNFEDVKQGRITFSSDGEELTIETRGDGEDGTVEISSSEGTVSLGRGGQLPSWIPAYPGVEAQGVYSARSGEGQSGNFSFNTSDSADKVIDFFESRFKQQDMKVSTNRMTSDGALSGAMLTAADSADKRTALIMLGVEDGKTSVNVTYGDK
ncbi:MAG: hypothetical protein ACK5AZ_04230 [Bryobacteraceae bacterium]